MLNVKIISGFVDQLIDCMNVANSNFSREMLLDLKSHRFAEIRNFANAEAAHLVAARRSQVKAL